ncbi:hypothetical protein PG994_001007 [Apiospora phragmitis]|uniref:F-box domain-containing protein n=1 Tax=Apiospora phragmitis TaxID=2905665 RepID=A0ABR1WRD8_9PEZI
MADPQSRRCLFETLPVEVHLNILKGLPDLTSLDSVLHASPKVYGVFAVYAVEITETILACDYKIVVSYHRHPARTDEIHHGPHPVESGITCAYVRVMFYMMAAIRSSKFPVHSLSDFCVKVIDPFWWRATTRRGRATPGYYMPESLPRDTPPGVLRSLVATHRRLNWLSLDCLKFYLARFESIRPSCPAIGRKAFARGRRAGTIHLDAEGLDEVPGRPVVMRDGGPPSWVEEQRMTRAFWRLQFVYDLRKAARASLLPTWPAEDVERLRNSDQTQLLSLFMEHDIAYPRCIEKEEIDSLGEYMEVAHGCHWPDEVPGSLQVSRAEWWPLPHHEARGDKKLAERSLGVRAKLHLAWYLNWRDFERDVELGFAFWSEERLQAIGLMGQCRRLGVWAKFKYAYVWHSINSGGGAATL